MKKFNLKHRVIGLLAIAALSVIYLQSQINQQQHLEITESILLFKENDLKLNQNVIQYQTVLYKNFDAISMARIQLDKSLQQLQKKIFLYSSTDKKLAELINQLAALEKKKTLLTDNYKKHAAVNKFTKQYLPKAFERVSEVTRRSSKINEYSKRVINERIEKLKNDMNRYIAGYDNDAAKLLKISDRLYLSVKDFHNKTDNSFELLSLYINKVVETDKILSEKISQIYEVQTTKNIEALQQRYTQLFEEKSDIAFKYKSLLFIASIFLLLYLGHILIRLQSTSSDLKQSLDHLEFRRQALDDHAIVSITDVKGIITYVNDKFCEISKYSREELLGQNHHIVKSEQHDAQFYRDMWRTIANGGIWQGQICNRAKDGSHYWVEATLKPRLDEKGKPYEYIGMRTDITAQKNAEHEIQALARFPMENPEPVMRVNKNGEITFFNPAAQVIVDHWQVALNDSLPQDWIDKMQEILNFGVNQEVEIIINDDQYLLVLTPFVESGYVNIYGRDITERKIAEASLSYQANHDRLTGLMNRYAFEFELEDALTSAHAQNKSHVLLYIDLDQFKIVNDTCGHVAGDSMLCQLSHIMHNVFREDDILARLGGDEFGVLLHNCEVEMGNKVAHKLLNAINHYRFIWEDKQFEVGASIGLVEINKQSDSIITVLGHADVACYAAKDDGRNQVKIFDYTDQESAQRHSELKWASQIPKALAENRFQLMVQSITPLKKGDDFSPHYEILLRMIGEDGGLIPPGGFIPAAERYNLMMAIDQWVVVHVFDYISEYIQHHGEENLPVFAINLSGESMGGEELLAYIRAQIEIKRVPAANICFEITETAAIGNLVKAIAFIKDLKELGCKFALDDFGSGLSSFSYLKSLPVDYLKIDGVFVKDMVNDPIDAAMVESINQVGHIMKIHTIAEFVENQQIMDALSALGVDYAQGYHIDKPTPIEEKFPMVCSETMKKVS